MKVWTENVYESGCVSRKAGAAGSLRAFVPELPPLSAARLRPAVLILPGGAYAYTSAREAEPIALRFAARGWAAFVLDYSCAPCRFPTALREAAAAMLRIRAAAGELCIHPRMVAAVGFSAGGHLAGTLATMFDAPEVRDIGAWELIRPDALGLCYPVAVSHGRTHAQSFDNLTGGDRALAERLSLDRLVRRDMPPVFLWHARDDGSVPCRGTLITAAALEDAGVSFAMHVYGSGGHGLSTADELVYRTEDLPAMSRDVTGWFPAMMDFFEENGLMISEEAEQ